MLSAGAGRENCWSRPQADFYQSMLPCGRARRLRACAVIRSLEAVTPAEAAFRRRDTNKSRSADPRRKPCKRIRRAAEVSKEIIVNAAIQELALKGFDGARVDLAIRGKIQKRRHLKPTPELAPVWWRVENLPQAS
ncbi:MAG TPA: hypothetical protein VGF60_01260 [Xanthobacteraceae bacterium]